MTSHDTRKALEAQNVWSENGVGAREEYLRPEQGKLCLQVPDIFVGGRQASNFIEWQIRKKTSGRSTSIQFKYIAYIKARLLLATVNRYLLKSSFSHLLKFLLQLITGIDP